MQNILFELSNNNDAVKLHFIKNTKELIPLAKKYESVCFITVSSYESKYKNVTKVAPKNFKDGDYDCYCIDTFVLKPFTPKKISPVEKEYSNASMDEIDRLLMESA